MAGKKKKTPQRDPKTGKFLTKAQKAARRRGHGRKKSGGHRKPRARAREAAPAVASERKRSASKARSAAARKAARTRKRNEASHKAKLAAARRRRAREDEDKRRARARRARAKDQLVHQRQGGKSKNWRTSRYPTGHPRAGQFKSTRPGSGAVHDNPMPLLAVMENPMSMPEWLIGGGSLALGAIGLALVDRVAATVALQDAGTKDASGNEQYTDPGGATGGPYAGLTNAAAYAAPMGLKRWLIAGAFVATPIVGGTILHYATEDGWPKLTAFLNFTGLGGLAYVLIKNGTDLGARLLRGTAFGQRVFDVEIRAQALKAQVGGGTYTGPMPPATGLGKHLGSGCGGGGCGDNCGCATCKQKNAPPPPPSFSPPAGGTNVSPPAPAPSPAPVVPPAQNLNNPGSPGFNPAYPVQPSPPGNVQMAPVVPGSVQTTPRIPVGPNAAPQRFMGTSGLPLDAMNWGGAAQA